MSPKLLMAIAEAKAACAECGKLYAVSPWKKYDTICPRCRADEKRKAQSALQSQEKK